MANDKDNRGIHATAAEKPEWPEEPEAGNEPSPERKEQYLEFKRKMDEFKGDCEGMVSEAESFKKQGNAYFTFGCYAQATIMYSDAIELQPHNSILYCNRAMAYLKQDMADLALADANRSLEIESSVDNIKAYWRKAQALYDLGQFEDSEAAASEGLEIQPRNPQINKVRRKAREAVVVKRLVAGDWVGKSNGMEQRYGFNNDCEMTMTVWGQKLTAAYELSVEGNPRSMVVRMKSEVHIPGQPPPPPMVYIFEFHGDDEELWLCHPVDGSQDLPTKFEGPGFVKYKRVEKALDAEEIASNKTLEEKCTDYMREMNKALPLIPPQLPEKPSEEQIKEEVEMCTRISSMKQRYGLEVHRRAVELAKEPSAASSEEMKSLAEQLQKRFVARKLLGADSKDVKAAPKPATPAVAPPAKEVSPSRPAPTSRTLPSDLPAGAELLPTKGLETIPVPEQRHAGLLAQLATCICCKSA